MDANGDGKVDFQEHHDYATQARHGLPWSPTPSRPHGLPGMGPKAPLASAAPETMSSGGVAVSGGPVRPHWLREPPGHDNTRCRSSPTACASVIQWSEFWASLFKQDLACLSKSAAVLYLLRLLRWFCQVKTKRLNGMEIVTLQCRRGPGVAWRVLPRRPLPAGPTFVQI